MNARTSSRCFKYAFLPDTGSVLNCDIRAIARSIHGVCSLTNLSIALAPLHAGAVTVTLPPGKTRRRMYRARTLRLSSKGITRQFYRTDT